MCNTCTWINGWVSGGVHGVKSKRLIAYAARHRVADQLRYTASRKQASHAEDAPAEPFMVEGGTSAPNIMSPVHPAAIVSAAVAGGSPFYLGHDDVLHHPHSLRTSHTRSSELVDHPRGAACTGIHTRHDVRLC